VPLWSTADEPALLECGDFAARARASERKRRQVAALQNRTCHLSVFCAYPSAETHFQLHPVKKDCVDTFAILLVVLSPYFLGA